MKLLNKGGSSTLNIFCDASITPIKNSIEKSTGCAGAVAMIVNDSHNIEDKDIITKVIPCTTNNYSELTAVLLGVYLAIRYKSNVNAINLFSDSKITIFGLREWIFNWVRGMQDGIMYSSSGEPVANQELIYEIINHIVYNNLQLSLYHQKGHVTGTAKSNDHAREVFLASNGIDLDLAEVNIISYYNNMIDNYSRETLYKYHSEDMPILTKPAYFTLEKLAIINDYKRRIFK